MTESLKVTVTQPAHRSGDLTKDIEGLRPSLSQETDVIVLPELIGSAETTLQYEKTIGALAREQQAFVIGGSHHRRGNTGVVNAGVVADPCGEIVTRYEKSRPYGTEQHSAVVPGQRYGQFLVGGRRFVVMICADFWFASSFEPIDGRADVVVVPAFSITQRPVANKPRQLWAHMASARAYEFATYVVVSDWASSCRYDGLLASGVAGVADPRPVDDSYYRSVGAAPARTESLDFARLDSFRRNRADRSFL